MMHTSRQRVVRPLLVASAIVFALVGCTSAPRAADSSPDPRLRGEWELSAAQDAYGPLNLWSTAITLTVSDTAHTGGRASCNPYRAHITGSLGVIYLTVVGHETSTCSNQTLLDLESRYLAALDNVHRASIRQDSLTLTGRKISLRFTRAQHIDLAAMTDQPWVLVGEREIGPHDLVPADDSSPARLRFSDTELITTTGCGVARGTWTQDAGEVVVSNFALRSDPASCTASNRAQESIVTRVLGSAFFVEVGPQELRLSNVRAGLQLEFVKETLRDANG
jgi:heat shock protein HslJ